MTFVFFVSYRKDVRLPVQLQRAMAAEAEAAREARAKVMRRPPSSWYHTFILYLFNTMKIGQGSHEGETTHF